MTAAAPLPEAERPTLVGHLHLEAAPDAEGRTVLARQSFRAPFHIGKAYWDGGVLQVRVINPTAGILSGDRLDLDARVAPGARALLMTPAASRAFTTAGGSAASRQRFSVGAGGWLEFAPEPLFPHRACDFAQVTRLDVAAGGELFYFDALAPGRSGRGEVWAWSRLLLQLEVTVAGDLVLRERFAGSGPDLGGLAAAYGMAEAWLGTAVVVSPRVAPSSPAWDLIRALHRPACRVGVTSLGAGCWVIRIIAEGSLALREATTALRSLLAADLPGLGSDLRRL